jgi:hypothetical protein
MGWPPGRTSLFLALFGIVCIAAYVTWERSRKARWAAMSLAAFLLSAMSYEQFVILAPCLLLTSVYLRWTGVRTRSWLLTPAFIITAAYVWWHLRYLPMNTRYQQEHARGALSIETDLLSWLFPASRDLHETRMILDPTFGLLALISAAFWICLLMAASNLNALRFAKSNWKLAAWSMAVSFVAFLPMAREKPLAHYLYFPGALRTVWIGVLLGGIVGVARRARGPRQEVAVVQVETRDVIAV